jgi:hypothetical protein
MLGWRCGRNHGADRNGAVGVALAALPSGRTPAVVFRFLPRPGPVIGTAVVLAGIEVIVDGSYCVVIVPLAWYLGACIRNPLYS